MGQSLHDSLSTMSLRASRPRKYRPRHLRCRAIPGEDDWGALSVGKRADVLLDADPLVDIRNTSRIHRVMARGVWYSRPS